MQAVILAPPEVMPACEFVKRNKEQEVRSNKKRRLFILAPGFWLLASNI
jgi:hypothetical protein